MNNHYNEMQLRPQKFFRKNNYFFYISQCHKLCHIITLYSTNLFSFYIIKVCILRIFVKIGEIPVCFGHFLVKIGVRELDFRR
jgi:hypothetical protein